MLLQFSFSLIKHKWKFVLVYCIKLVLDGIFWYAILILADVGLFNPINLFLSLVKKETTKKVYFTSFAILRKPALEYKSLFKF